MQTKAMLKTVRDGVAVDYEVDAVDFLLTDEQWAALLWLAISPDSDDPGSRVNRSLRDEVEHIVSEWPKECRPFP